MRNILMTLFGLLYITCSGQIKYSGQTIDSQTLEPIKNVNVIVGDSIIAFTNELGIFEFELPMNSPKVVTQHVSYKSSQITGSDGTTNEIKLSRDIHKIPDFDIRSFGDYKRYEVIPETNETRPSTDTARYPGGIEALYNYLGDNLIIEDSILEEIVEGNTYINFSVSNTGKVQNLALSGDTMYSIGDKITSLFMQMPEWKPALQRNEPCEQHFRLALNFGEYIFVGTEIPPLFPSDPENSEWASFPEYVKSNLKYTEIAKRNGVQGSVYVQCVVNRRGEIIKGTVKVIKGLGFGLDEEAVRLVQESPKWSPSWQKGNAVFHRMVLRIVFAL